MMRDERVAIELSPRRLTVAPRTLSNERQMEVLLKLLGIRPDATGEQLMEVVRILFGVAVSGTTILNARRAAVVPHREAALGEKLQYVRALLTLYPELTPAAVEERTLRFFNEQINEKVVYRLQADPLPRPEAEALVRQVESASNGRGFFGGVEG